MTQAEFKKLQYEMENTTDANTLFANLLSNKCYNITVTKIRKKVTNGNSYTWEPALFISWLMLDNELEPRECFNCFCSELK